MIYISFYNVGGNMSNTELIKADYKKAEKKALEILDVFGLQTPPVNPVMIANHYNIEVLFIPFPEIHKNISGIFDANDNVIYVNNADSPLRQTFTIAHELGHKFLHAIWLNTAEYEPFLRSNLELSKDKNPIEQEADAFAAHLLVPKFMLNKYKNIATISELSQLFMVSMPVIQNRVKYVSKKWF